MKKERILPLVITALIIGLGGALLIEWLVKNNSADISYRNPSEEKVEGLTAPAEEGGKKTDEKGKLYKEIGLPSKEKGSWLQFRGSDQTNIAVTESGLLSKPLAEPARTIWREKTGEGYAGPVVNAGRVYFIDYDAARKEDSIRCLSLKDGIEIWKYNYPERADSHDIFVIHRRNCAGHTVISFYLHGVIIFPDFNSVF